MKIPSSIFSVGSLFANAIGTLNRSKLQAISFGMLAAFSSTQSAIAYSDQAVYSATVREMLFDISFEGKEGIAVGDFGLILKSEDGGLSWNRNATAFTDFGLFGVVRKKGACIAVGQQGLIYKSEDCSSWSKADSGTDGRLLAIDMNDQGVAYAVGGFGVLLKSTDWGASWQAIQPDWNQLSDGIEPHLYSVVVDSSGAATVSGEFGLIMRTTDGGDSWSPLNQGEKSIFGMHFLHNGVGYAVGQEGLILKTVDNGDNWTELDSPTESILTGVWASPEGWVQISGINTLLASDDAGVSFSSKKNDSINSGWFQSTTASSSANGEERIIVVGSGASVRVFEPSQNK